MKQICLSGLLIGMLAIAAPPTTTNVTFNKDVLPILQKNCQTCHRPGEIAPMSLLTYKDARPWAKSIKTAVVSKKMPPWFADQTPRHFTNEKRLTEAEINTLVAWVDSGAAEGNAKDRLAPVHFPEGWNMSTPDIVVEMPQPHDVPLTGDNENIYFIAKGNFTEDTWIEAAEVRPSNRTVVHHMRVWVRPPGTNWLQGAPYGPAVPLDFQRAPQAGPQAGKDKQKRAPGSETPGAQQEIIAKYNPGTEPQVFTMNGAAKLIPKGSDIVFEAHYTTVGKPAADQSKIGFKLAKTAPALRYVTLAGLGNSRLNILPGDSNSEVRQEAMIDRDVTVAWLQPHMHLRGKDYTLTAFYPSGESEVILKTRFDFSWQIGYTFEKPLLLPKGTRLLGISHFDNSANNKYNPDPTKTVRWGVQSTDEMSLLYFGVVIEPKTDPQKVFARLITATPFD
jgi:hypothetical protein